MNWEEAKKTLLDYAKPNGVGFPDVKEAVHTIYQDMPLICLRCGKDIPLPYGVMGEISYTHYSYCEDCLREGLKLLREKDKEVGDNGKA